MKNKEEASRTGTLDGSVICGEGTDTVHDEEFRREGTTVGWEFQTGRCMDRLLLTITGPGLSRLE